MIRAKQVNELYYARDNNPSFYQFKENYHFIDAEGRQYMIAVKNRQVFQNAAFKEKGRPKDKGPKEPVRNNSGLTLLYVKLTDPTTKWFGHGDMGKPLLLREKISGATHVVTLKSQEKHNVKRRTGNIYVKGLLKQDLMRLLNA